MGNMTKVTNDSSVLPLATEGTQEMTASFSTISKKTAHLLPGSRSDRHAVIFFCISCIPLNLWIPPVAWDTDHFKGK